MIAGNSSPQPPSDVPETVRWRLTWTLFGGVALGGTAYLAAFTVAAIVAAELTDSPSLAGLPAAIAIAGGALGAMVLSGVMRAWGRRPGLVLGYLTGVVGAAMAGAGALLGSFTALLAGSVLIGVGNSANQLARYAATDAHPVGHRGRVLGWVVWAVTIGAVAGPALGTDVAARAGALGSAYFVSVVAYALAATGCFTLLRPDPASLATKFPDLVRVVPDAGSGRIEGDRVTIAVVGLVTSQCVMVLLMTMAPVHLRQHGVAVSSIGWVMSSHVLGMYALTPLFGALVDRFGGRRVLALGLALLAASGLMGTMAAAHGAAALAGAMFVLGIGWSCGFVAASGLLATHGSYAERARMQGRADSIVYAVAAVASVLSGPLLGAIGYGRLCLIGAVLVVPAALMLARGKGSRAWGWNATGPDK